MGIATKMKTHRARYMLANIVSELECVIEDLGSVHIDDPAAACAHDVADSLRDSLRLGKVAADSIRILDEEAANR